MSHLKLTLMVLPALLCLAAQALAYPQSQGFRIEGAVLDQAGAPVTGAEVVFTSGSFTVAETTDGEGRFVFIAVTPSSGTLTVRARGFEEVNRSWAAAEANAARLEIVLKPALVSEQVTVTASRTQTRVSDTAASILVLSSEDLATTAALTLDDALRQVPGFSLFRRSGSRTANPTSQGVSLRGVGASGASRAVALDDGIPLNDPFGGWVYWGRVPRESVARVEVVRGGASNLYGTDALGGVINFIPRTAEMPALSLETSYGNQQTANGSLFAGGQFAQISARLSAAAFHTDGYRLVDERERGRVDTEAGVTYRTLGLTLDRLISESGRVFVSGSVFSESRRNGTPLQRNRTHIRQLAAGLDLGSQSAGQFAVRAYGSSQVFDQDFSAVAQDRASETLTRSQRVPAGQSGLSAQWSRAFGSAHTLVAGFEARQVYGASDELVFVAGGLTSAVGAGGRERVLAAFGQDIIRITPRWLVTAGVRIDRWRNYNALSTAQPLALPGPTVVTVFDDRSETALSPRLSLLHKLTDNVTLSASAYRAFRAPTLNELYRSFRVGNVVTLANDRLRAERLTGGEAGASLAALEGRMTMRGTFFWSEITRPIANVTLRFTPELITRQRQNLGRTRSRGVELEAEGRITRALVISGGYLFADASVLEFPANTLLEGLLIPQVPRHQLTFQARYSDARRVTVGVQGRAVGDQFDDDQNQFRLGRYFTLDAMVSRQVARGVEFFAAAENLLDQRYAIGRTPVKTVGPPLLVRLGFRLQLGAR